MAYFSQKIASLKNLIKLTIISFFKKFNDYFWTCTNLMFWSEMGFYAVDIHNYFSLIT